MRQFFIGKIVDDTTLLPTKLKQNSVNNHNDTTIWVFFTNS